MNIDEFRSILPGMTDLSCVRADNTIAEIGEMAELAVSLKAAAVFALPANTELLCGMMSGTGITVGGTVGFPSGCEETDTKLFITERLLKYGCGEIDMVINQTDLRSGREERVIKDISAVCDLCGDVPVKVILEVNNLTPEQIRFGCRLAERAGASFVKSGTGWNPKPTTVEQIRIMRESVSERVQVKAAGGIKDIKTAYDMYCAGCRRFGESVHSAKLVLGLN